VRQGAADKGIVDFVYGKKKDISFYHAVLLKRNAACCPNDGHVINKTCHTFTACTWKNVNAVKLIAPAIIIRLIYPANISSEHNEDGSVFSRVSHKYRALGSMPNYAQKLLHVILRERQLFLN